MTAPGAGDDWRKADSRLGGGMWNACSLRRRTAQGGVGAALRSLVVVAWRWIADGIVKFIVNAIAGHTQSHFGYRGRA